MRILLSCALLGSALSQPLQAEVILACTFPTLPSLIMRFPDDKTPKTMEVAARPAVPLVEGQGEGRLITASVDGFDFRFAPASSTLDVEREGELVSSETGTCVTIGGPTNEVPIEIASTAAPTEELTPDPAEEPAESVADTGKWEVSEDVSAFDDTRTVILSLESSEPIRGQFGPPGPAVLILRCMENTTAAYLLLNDLFLSDIEGYGMVEYRIDEQQANAIRMWSSTDNKALGLWDGGKSIPFIKTLIDGERIVLRATPFNESPVEFAFDLAGLETAITSLREACAW